MTMPYPYRTKALFSDETWRDVTVLAPPRTVAVKTRLGFKHAGMHLVTVKVDGEQIVRRIAVERLAAQHEEI